MVCCYMMYILYAFGAISVYFGWKIVEDIIIKRKLDRWSKRKTPTNVVILHGLSKSRTAPCSSSFMIKLETYLLMAKIPYKHDTKDVFGPKGKEEPWISLNGKHIEGCQLIIPFLEKKFENNLNGNYTEEQLAVATAVRVMLEEQFCWGVALELFVFGGFKHLEDILQMPFLMKYLIRRKIKKASWNQGIGRYSEEEVVKITMTNLKSVSIILGEKKYICGDEPCEDDCAIFGQLAQAVWGLPESRYEKLVNTELSNLKEYCIRMRQRFYPDLHNFSCFFKFNKHCISL